MTTTLSRRTLAALVTTATATMAIAGVTASASASAHPALTKPASSATLQTSRIATVRPATNLSATPAQRTATKAPTQLSLTGAAPSTLTKGSSLTVKIAVRNTATTTLHGQSVTVALGRTALDTLDAQNRWSAGEQRLTSAITASATVPDVAAGASTTVSVTIPADKLDLSFSMTSLPLQATLSGTSAVPLRSFVTWSSATSSSVTAMQASIVVPITLPDDPALLTATGAARFAAWNKAIGPDSAIAKMLASNPSAPVTWLIDPAVLDPAAAQDGSLPTQSTSNQASATGSGETSTASSSASASAAQSSPGSASATSPSASSSTAASASSSASTSSSSSSSATSSGSTATPTTVEQLADALIAKLKNRPSTQQVAFTPYGDPDLSTLTADDRPSGSDTLLARSLARPLSAQLKAISSTIVAAPTAPLDASAVDRLTAAWTKQLGSKPIILTPNVTLDGSDDVSVSSAARRSTSDATLVGYQSALSRPLSDSSLTSDTAAQLQESAASLALYQQLPSKNRSLLIMGDRLSTTSPARLSAIISSLDEAQWAETSTLDLSAKRSSGTLAQLSAKAPSSDAVWPKPSTSAFETSDVTTAADTLKSLTATVSALVASDDVVPAWTRNLDQEAGTRWRGNPSAVDALVSHAARTVASIPAQVHVVPARINFFSGSGSISVTVKNDLARDVRDLRLELVPRNYAVQFPTQPTPMTIKAGSANSFRVPLEAHAAARVNVDARLSAAGGVAFGPKDSSTSPLEINARPTGTWIFWVLGIVAVLVFCYGLVRARQKGTRRRDELARDIQL